MVLFANETRKPAKVRSEMVLEHENLTERIVEAAI
jgi:hypothetical protein